MDGYYRYRFILYKLKINSNTCIAWYKPIINMQYSWEKCRLAATGSSPDEKGSINELWTGAFANEWTGPMAHFSGPPSGAQASTWYSSAHKCTNSARTCRAEARIKRKKYGHKLFCYNTKTIYLPLMQSL